MLPACPKASTEPITFLPVLNASRARASYRPSADSRKFFATTSAQIEQIRSDMDGVIGTEGALVKVSEEAREAIKAADLPATAKSAREAADNSRLASDDLRRSLPAIRDSLEQLRELSRMLEEQPESVVYGPRPREGKRP